MLPVIDRISTWSSNWLSNRTALVIVSTSSFASGCSSSKSDRGTLRFVPSSRAVPRSKIRSKVLFSGNPAMVNFPVVVSTLPL